MTMNQLVRLKRARPATITLDERSPERDAAASSFSKVMNDDYFSSWPDSLVSYLNMPFDPEEERIRAYKAHNPNWRESMSWAKPNVARRLRRRQRQVRTLVDSLLEGASPEQIAARLNEELGRVRVTPSLWLRSELGLPLPASGSPFVLRWCRWSGRDPDAQSALVDLARLYDSGDWQSLRKCPQCRRYFIAVDRRRKKYCNQQCMWQATQRRFRSKETEAARAQRRKRDRERYLRRGKREAGLALSK